MFFEKIGILVVILNKNFIDVIWDVYLYWRYCFGVIMICFCGEVVEVLKMIFFKNVIFIIIYLGFNGSYFRFVIIFKERMEYFFRW